MTEMPSEEAIRKSVEKVGYQQIVLDSINSTVFLSTPGMKIGFGALGEGYAADKCRDMMVKRGILAGIVNGTGDMSIWGKQPNGKPWLVGIRHPFHRDSLFARIPIHFGAIVTSGTYEKYVTFNGKRYSHIINPVTGYPATGIISVTVMGPQSELANGFSTSIMVLGKDDGLALINRFPEYCCIIFTDNGEIFLSANLNPQTVAQWRALTP
ncbi:FAD:protein FMN transferase [compost metagenome]